MEPEREELEMGEDVLYQKDASFSAEIVLGTSQSPDLEQKYPETTPRPTGATESLIEPCLDCGQGLCLTEPPRCQCPLGKVGPHCKTGKI